MNPEDVLRMIDVIHRDKDIPKEVIFRGLEDALAAGVRKRLGVGEDLVVHIDRKSGEVTMEDAEEEYEFDLAELGRIAAQAFKQSLMQRLREAERDVLFEEYEARVGQLVNGVVQRFEGDFLVVNLGKVEAYLSKEDRVRGETFNPGDRIRAIIVEVRKDGSRVRILVSRTHPDLVRRLFELEVPEIADGIIEIKRVVREPGYRTKMAVISQDPKIDCIGACVGVRGSRIKAVIDELRGERADIIRRSDAPRGEAASPHESLRNTRGPLTQKKRIYDLAKEYGMSGDDLAKKLRDLGFTEVKGRMTALDDFMVLQIQGTLEAHGLIPESLKSAELAGGGLVLKKKKKKLGTLTDADAVEAPSPPAPAETPPAETPAAPERKPRARSEPAPAAEPAAAPDPVAEREVEEAQTVEARAEAAPEEIGALPDEAVEIEPLPAAAQAA